MHSVDVNPLRRLRLYGERCSTHVDRVHVFSATVSDFGNCILQTPDRIHLIRDPLQHPEVILHAQPRVDHVLILEDEVHMAGDPNHGCADDSDHLLGFFTCANRD
jgi:hypothetical protein